MTHLMWQDEMSKGLQDGMAWTNFGKRMDQPKISGTTSRLSFWACGRRVNLLNEGLRCPLNEDATDNVFRNQIPMMRQPPRVCPSITPKEPEMASK